MANLIVVLYYSHHIPLAQYGSYQIFWTYLMVLSTIACGGIGVLIYSYNLSTVYQILSKIRRAYYFYYGLFSLLMGLVFYGLLYREVSSNAQQTLTLLAVLFFLTYSWNVILEAVLIIAKRFTLLLFLSIFHSVCFFLIHYYVAQHTFSLSGLIAGLALLATLRFAIMLPFAVQSIKTSDLSDARPVHVKRVFSMWISLLTYDTTQILFRYLDKFIITFLVVKELTAIYMNGTIDIPFLPVFFAAVGNAALLQLTKVAQRDKKFTLSIIRQSSINLATIAIPLFCYLFFFRYELIRFIFSEKYMAAAPIFAISIFKLLTYLFTLPFFLQYRQRGDLLNKGAALDMACSLLLIFPLYWWLGLNGMILSFVISSFIQVSYYAWCAAKLLKVNIGVLLPLKNWAAKFICFISMTVLHHLFWQRFVNDTIALIVSGILLAAASLTWLFIEYKRVGMTTFASETI